MHGYTRRQVLTGAALAATAVAGARCGGNPVPRATSLRRPGSLPHPAQPPGTDTIPEIDHIVVVMLENHTFDNLLGTLGGADGLPRDAVGRPDATNPDGAGHLIRSFAMPTPCQEDGHPSNTWAAGHTSFAAGRMDGFVRSPSGPVAMGYWDTRATLPFTASLARTFPIGDRYFSSVMAQTYPNRRYLLAATSVGEIADTLSDPALPPAGTILDLLDAHGISWKNYFSTLPTVGVFIRLLSNPRINAGCVPIDQFYAAAAAGTLPAFSIVDPDFGTSSEENPQDIQYGDVFLSRVVRAVLDGPAWPKTLLVWTYDEGGGYYDHVPPPAAVPPDGVAPILGPGDPPGVFDRYGFRVPFGVVSPYARKRYVSHVVHDHASILKLVETKWNLPALTRRDANADDLLDSLDLHRPPAFARPPPLADPADAATLAACRTVGPGTIPPPSAIRPARS